ncbi:hypothetical protein [Streptomyces kaempferi]|uniref:Uncharacterized protein n=1 Tax=Streptomyces kaempferi TaxID=333725 RepID=A0ABW3XL22_9ACTN
MRRPVTTVLLVAGFLFGPVACTHDSDCPAPTPSTVQPSTGTKTPTKAPTSNPPTSPSAPAPTGPASSDPSNDSPSATDGP